jgi:molecular chaperone GrpE
MNILMERILEKFPMKKISKALKSFSKSYLDKLGISPLDQKEKDLMSIELIELIGKNIQQFVIKSKVEQSYVDDVGKAYENLENRKAKLDEICDLIQTDYEILDRIQVARSELDSFNQREIRPFHDSLEIPQLLTSSEWSLEFELDPILEFAMGLEGRIVDDPSKILTLVAAKISLGQDEFIKMKNQMDITIDFDDLDEMIEDIEGLLPLCILADPSSSPRTKLKNLQDINTEIDEIESRITEKEQKLSAIKDALDLTEYDLYNNLFIHAEQESFEFLIKDRFLIDKVKEVAVILKRLEMPMVSSKELKDEISSILTEGISIYEDHLFEILSRFELLTSDGGCISSSLRELISFNLSKQLLIQEDFFIQDRARRNLVRIINDRKSYIEKNSFSNKTSEELFKDDLHKLMDVTSKFGKQIFKLSTVISHQKDLSASSERDKPSLHQAHIIDNAEISELSRLLRTFKKDLEGDLIKKTRKEVILKLLGVLDFFDNILNNLPKDIHSETDIIIEGLKMTHNKLLRVLSDFGLEVMNCLDEKFNPEYHECVDSRKISGKESDIIIKEVIRGYKMGNEIIRYPKVIVSA